MPWGPWTHVMSFKHPPGPVLCGPAGLTWIRSVCFLDTYVKMQTHYRNNIQKPIMGIILFTYMKYSSHYVLHYSVCLSFPSTITAMFLFFLVLFPCSSLPSSTQHTHSLPTLPPSLQPCLPPCQGVCSTLRLHHYRVQDTTLLCVRRVFVLW